MKPPADGHRLSPYGKVKAVFRNSTAKLDLDQGAVMRGGRGWVRTSLGALGMRSLVAALLLLATAPLASAAESAWGAEPERGREIFQARCARCHAISAQEPGKRGPYLAGLFRRGPGAVAGFPYRMVFTTQSPTWTDGALDQYLEIHLLPDQPDRLDVIAFLHEAAR
jgi:cytochrome c2